MRILHSASLCITYGLPVQKQGVVVAPERVVAELGVADVDSHHI